MIGYLIRKHLTNDVECFFSAMKRSVAYDLLRQ